jgi:hypothetical protein
MAPQMGGCVGSGAVLLGSLPSDAHKKGWMMRASSLKGLGWQVMPALRWRQT